VDRTECIALETRAGSHAIVVTATTRAGRELAARHVLKVVAKRFPQRRLQVAPRFTEPSPEDRRASRARSAPEGALRVDDARVAVAGRFGLPVASHVTSTFGVRRTFNGRTQSVHRGLDLAGAVGTPVVAPNAGRVALSDDLFFSGNTVIIDHGQGLISLLAHLSRLNVREGAVVEKGAVVGEVGATAASPDRTCTGRFASAACTSTRSRSSASSPSSIPSRPRVHPPPNLRTFRPCLRCSASVSRF